MGSGRRGHGEGSVYRRKDGYWVGQVDVGRSRGGKRRYARVVRRYKADVLAELPRLREQVAQGVVPDRTATVASFLRFWLDDVKEGTIEVKTLRNYRSCVARIVRDIGQVKLHKLTTTHVQFLANRLGQEYAPGVRRLTLVVLRQALGWAVAADLVPRNVAEGVKPPKTPRANVDDTLTAEEAKAVLAVAQGSEDGLYPLAWFGLKYGLRLGEILNLRWADIDFGKGEMSVRRSKTAAGVRTLPLTSEARTVLEGHRKAQDVAPIGGHVLIRPDGRPLSQRRVGEAWNTMLSQAKVGHMCRNCDAECTHGATDERPCRQCRCSSSVRRFHASRHTAATLLLESGVELEVVSAILGHSSISVTADIYAKVRNDLKRKGLEKVS